MLYLKFNERLAYFYWNICAFISKEDLVIGILSAWKSTGSPEDTWNVIQSVNWYQIECKLKPNKVWNTCLDAKLQSEIEYEQSTSKKFSSNKQNFLHSNRKHLLSQYLWQTFYGS